MLRPYTDEISENEQIDMENMIARAVQEAAEGEGGLEDLAACKSLSRDILLNVLMKYRSDLIQK